jgi:hypothetical protein
MRGFTIFFEFIYVFEFMFMLHCKTKFYVYLLVKLPYLYGKNKSLLLFKL